jgi:hypothetical protein
MGDPFPFCEQVADGEFGHFKLQLDKNVNCLFT